jgi:hypothetical protein
LTLCLTDERAIDVELDPAFVLEGAARTLHHFQPLRINIGRPSTEGQPRCQSHRAHRGRRQSSLGSNPTAVRSALRRPPLAEPRCGARQRSNASPRPPDSHDRRHGEELRPPWSKPAPMLERPARLAHLLVSAVDFESDDEAATTAVFLPRVGSSPFPLRSSCSPTVTFGRVQTV